MQVGDAIDTEAMNLDAGGARALCCCGPTAGDFFPRLTREFVALGGSFSACPFAQDYAGPVIRWSDEGWPYMYSSKQKELFHEGSI